MAHELRGRVWILGDDIDTGQILPHAVFTDPERDEESCAKLFQEVSPGLAAKLQPGDIVWAGEGFGQGGSSEEAPRVLKQAGIRLVLASSFARIFYRNAVNIGLPVAVGDPGNSRDGDELQVNLVTGEVTNVTRELKLRIEPVPKAIRPILSSGGLIEYVREHGSLPEAS